MSEVNKAVIRRFMQAKTTQGSLWLRVQLLLVICAAVSLVSACPGPKITPGFYTAFIRADGRIQTNFSVDGTAWEAKFRVIHDEKSPFGPGIAAQPTSLVALAFFSTDQLAGGTKLIVKRGLGPTGWQGQDSPIASLATTTSSAPAISYIKDDTYVVAWNDGSAVRTASLNSMGLADTGIIAGTAGADINGAPSIAAHDNQALMVWLSRTGDAKKFVIHSAVSKFNGGRITWRLSSDLHLPIPTDANFAITGNPSIFWDGATFLMAVPAQVHIFSSNDEGLGDKWVVLTFTSTDGSKWIFTEHCHLSTTASREYLAVAGRNGKTRLLISPEVQNEGIILGSTSIFCTEVTWNSMFSDNGAIDMSPALTHNLAP